MKHYDAMVIIDMQTALVEGHPCQERKVLDTIKKLQTACRQKQIPVIFVRHDGGTGDELEFGSSGWQIYEEIAPQTLEKIVEKRFNSAFRQTDLKEYLEKIQAKNLIMCGMQTEFCFDVSVKVAFEHGYQVTIPQGGATTFDTDFMLGEKLEQYFEEKIWNNRYAQVVPVEEILEHIMHSYVRKAEAGDASRLAEILIFTKRMSYRCIFHNDDYSFNELRVLDLAMEFQQDEEKRRDIYVYDDGIVRGLIHWSPEPSRAQIIRIHELYVDSFFHGGGIGRSLMRDCMEQAKKTQAKGLVLWVLEKNAHARAFYESFGFQWNGTYTLEEGTPEKLLEYECSL